MTAERIDHRCGNQVVTAKVATAPSPSRAGRDVSAGHDGGGAVATWPSPVFPGRNLQGVAVGQGNALPHWEMRGVVYHVCFRLADSVPQAKLQEWLDERQHLMQSACQSGRALTDDEVARLKYLYSENIEKYLDSNYGACWLRDAQTAEIVIQTLLHDNGTQYRLIAYGLMPNHCHVMIELSKDVTLASVVQAWKSVSSHRINRLLERKGELWQADYYNHIIRTGQSFYRQLSYVFGNNQVASWRFDMSRGGAE